MFVDLGIGILSVTMPFSYVALPPTFSFSFLGDIGNMTLLSILSEASACSNRIKRPFLLSLGSYIQDIAYNSEVNILLDKAWQNNDDYRSLPLLLCQLLEIGRASCRER